MRTTKGATKPENEGAQENDPETQVDEQTEQEDLEDDERTEDDPRAEDGAAPKRKVRVIRTAKVGDTVTLRRAGSCRKILHDPAKVKYIDGGQVATLEILDGRSKGQVQEGVKRYNLADAIGPTDQVLPSWIADAFEVG